MTLWKPVSIISDLQCATEIRKQMHFVCINSGDNFPSLGTEKINEICVGGEGNVI